MISYHYNICGLHLQVNTEKSIWEEVQSAVFSAPGGTPDILLNLTKVPEIPVPEGAPCPGHREYPTWRSGELISRCSHDLFRAKMHFRTDYDLNHPSELTCLVREEDWRWATRSKYLWPGIMLNYILLHHRGMIFHASYVAHEGNGILFTAPSGTGKSTQAELWRTHRGAEIVNGDKAGVTLNGIPTAHGVPFSGTSGICENVSLPLKAIVVLAQAPENTIHRLPPSQAVAALFPNLFVDRAITEEWQLALSLLLDLVSAVPVYELSCTPDVRAVEVLEQAMKEDAR